MHTIKKFCNDNDITLKDFSVRVGTSAPYLSQIVKGYRKPSADVALAIEQATGGAVTLRELLFPDKAKAGAEKQP